MIFYWGVVGAEREGKNLKDRVLGGDMGILQKIWDIITGDEYKWIKLTELCPYCDNYFEKKHIEKHKKICSEH